jgi:ribosomal protein L35AE/L33A
MSSLYTKGRILGHKRGKRNSRPNQSLVQIEGVDSQEAARSYLGKVGDHSPGAMGWNLLWEGRIGGGGPKASSAGDGQAKPLLASARR